MAEQHEEQAAVRAAGMSYIYKWLVAQVPELTSQKIHQMFNELKHIDLTYLLIYEFPL